jgi:hypothetical protein
MVTTVTHPAPISPKLKLLSAIFTQRQFLHFHSAACLSVSHPLPKTEILTSPFAADAVLPVSTLCHRRQPPLRPARRPLSFSLFVCHDPSLFGSFFP